MVTWCKGLCLFSIRRRVPTTLPQLFLFALSDTPSRFQTHFTSPRTTVSFPETPWTCCPPPVHRMPSDLPTKSNRPSSSGLQAVVKQGVYRQDNAIDCWDACSTKGASLNVSVNGHRRVVRMLRIPKNLQRSDCVAVVSRIHTLLSVLQLPLYPDMLSKIVIKST